MLEDLGLSGEARRTFVGKLGFRSPCTGLGFRQSRLEGFDVIRFGHAPENSTFARFCGPLGTPGESTRRSWSPGALRVAPIDPFKQIAKLSRRNRHHPIGRRRPDELAAFKPFCVERQTEAVMPEHFQKITFTTPKT